MNGREKDKEKKGLLNLNQKQVNYVTKMAYVVIIAVLLISAANMFSPDKPTDSQSSQVAPVEPRTTASETDISLIEREIESRLERILGKIQGVGKVNVSVTLESGPTYEYVMNVSSNVRTTEEMINDGTRSIDEAIEEGTLVLKRGQGSVEKPVILKETKPVIKGVLVVAEGANEGNVRLQLSRAVETVLGVSAYQVHVLPMGR